MGRIDYIAMTRDAEAEAEAAASLAEDLNELKAAANKLFNHHPFGSSFFAWVLADSGSDKLEKQHAHFTFLTLPHPLFKFLRGEVGKWIAFMAVVTRLFCPRRFPEWAEMPGSLILLLVVTPEMFGESLRGEWMGVAICMWIGCYLLQEHVRASGGFRNSLTQRHGISNTVGIILLLLFPARDLLHRIL